MFKYINHYRSLVPVTVNRNAFVDKITDLFCFVFSWQAPVFQVIFIC